MENAENPNEVDLTEQGIRTAAKALGYNDAEIEEVLKGFDDFPLSDELLASVNGGGGIHRSFKIKIQY